MGNGIAQIHVKRERGMLTVITYGQGPRGQKFIRQTMALKAPTTASPDFKNELGQVVEKLTVERPLFPR